MRVVGEPGRLVVLDGSEEVGSIELHDYEGHLYCRDFRAEGPGAARVLGLALVSLARRRPLHFSMVDDPVHDRLRSLLGRHGGRKSFEVWTLEVI